MVYLTEMLKQLHSIYLPTLLMLDQYVENYRLLLSVCLSFLSALKLGKKVWPTPYKSNDKCKISVILIHVQQNILWQVFVHFYLFKNTCYGHAVKYFKRFQFFKFSPLCLSDNFELMLISVEILSQNISFIFWDSTDCGFQLRIVNKFRF